MMITPQMRAVFGEHVTLDANGQPVERGIGSVIEDVLDIVEVLAPETVPVVTVAEAVAPVVIATIEGS